MCACVCVCVCMRVCHTIECWMRRWKMWCESQPSPCGPLTSEHGVKRFILCAQRWLKQQGKGVTFWILLLWRSPACRTPWRSVFKRFLFYRDVLGRWSPNVSFWISASEIGKKNRPDEFLTLIYWFPVCQTPIPNRVSWPRHRSLFCWKPNIWSCGNSQPDKTIIKPLALTIGPNHDASRSETSQQCGLHTFGGAVLHGQDGSDDWIANQQMSNTSKLVMYTLYFANLPQYLVLAPASGPKNEYDAGSKRCLAAWLEWGNNMRRTTMVTPRPDLRSQKSYPLRWCEGSQKWCLRQPRTKTIDILWHFAGSVQWEWTVFKKKHQHIYQNHWNFAGFVHSQSAKTPTVHFRSSNLSRMSESQRDLTTLLEDCGWMEGYEARWGNMKMGCHSKAQQT